MINCRGVYRRKIEYPEYEKTIAIRRDSKSIRLDVYVKDSDSTIYNVEIQQSANINIPKRTRYYQGLIDMELLEKGNLYDTLNKSFVIFICTFDYFNYDRYQYTFTYKCNEISGLNLDNETTVIILNSKGNKGNVSDDLKNFLKCINGEYTSSEFSAKLRDEVEKVKNSEKWRREYMTLYLHEQEIKAQARMEGIEEGKKEGIEEGKLTMLVSLVNDGLLSTSDAAKKACISEDEFIKLLNEA